MNANELTLAVILDVIAKAGALGTATLIIWALVTERLVPRGRLEDQKRMDEERLVYRQEIIIRQQKIIDEKQRQIERLEKRGKP